MGIVRVIYTHKVFFQSYDAIWIAPVLLVWTHMELHVGIICACAPALKAFFTHYDIVSFGTQVLAPISRRNQASEKSTSANSASLQKSEDSSKSGKDLYSQELQDIDDPNSVTCEGSWRPLCHSDLFSYPQVRFRLPNILTHSIPSTNTSPSMMVI